MLSEALVNNHGERETTREVMLRDRAVYDKAYPELWRRCYPRVYREPAPSYGQFYSPKSAAYEILETLLAYENYVDKGETSRPVTDYLWASQLISRRVPIYWVSKDLATAICKTTPPVTINWCEMVMPLEAMVLMIPRGTLPLQNHAGAEVSMISFARLKAGQTVQNLLDPTVSEGPSPDSILSIYATVVHPERLDRRMAMALFGRFSTSVSLPESESFVANISDKAAKTELPDWAARDLVDKADAPHMALIMRFLFNVLLLMLNKSDLVTPGSLERRVMRARGAQEFWSPTVIGERYRIKRPPLGGTHSSPRLHWVRGFWREQPYGPQGSLRREQWIEPYVRGEGE